MGVGGGGGGGRIETDRWWTSIIIIGEFVCKVAPASLLPATALRPASRSDYRSHREMGQNWSRRQKKNYIYIYIYRSISFYVFFSKIKWMVYGEEMLHREIFFFFPSSAWNFIAKIVGPIEMNRSRPLRHFLPHLLPFARRGKRRGKRFRFETSVVIVKTRFEEKETRWNTRQHERIWT